MTIAEMGKANNQATTRKQGIRNGDKMRGGGREGKNDSKRKQMNPLFYSM